MKLLDMIRIRVYEEPCVNQLLIDTKNNGFIYDKEHNTVGFWLLYLLLFINHYDLHYTSDKYPEVSYDDEPDYNIAETTNSASSLCYETKCDAKKFSRNRILFGAPGTGKSFTLNKEAKELLADEGHEERVTSLIRTILMLILLAHINLSWLVEVPHT